MLLMAAATEIFAATDKKMDLLTSLNGKFAVPTTVSLIKGCVELHFSTENIDGQRYVVLSEYGWHFMEGKEYDSYDQGVVDGRTDYGDVQISKISSKENEIQIERQIYKGLEVIGVSSPYDHSVRGNEEVTKDLAAGRLNRLCTKAECPNLGALIQKEQVKIVKTSANTLKVTAMESAGGKVSHQTCSYRITTEHPGYN